MIINVPEEDIKNGRQRFCRACPIALAMSRTLNVPVFVFDQCWDAYLTISGVDAKKLPLNVIEFIKDYDNNRTVTPFSFEVDVGGQQ